MTPHDGHDPLLSHLQLLRPVAPDPDRARRLRTRCLAQLERGRRRSRRTAQVTRFAQQVLAPAVVGGLCVLYIAELVSTALGLHGVFD